MFLEKIIEKLDVHIVKNIVLEDLAIDFTNADSWATTVSSDNMIARLTHIPGFTWPIQKVQLTVVIRDNGRDVGKLESPYQPASVSGGIISSTICRSTMTVIDGSRPAFSDFVTALVTKDQHTFAVRGSADIIFNLGLLGKHSINGVDFLSDLTLRGLNNLPMIKCTAITDITVNGNELLLKATLDILNPSQLSLTLGDLTLSILSLANDLSSEDKNQVKDGASADGSGEEQRNPQQTIPQPMGTITLDNLSLTLGMNGSRTATIKLDTSLETTRQFLKGIEKEPKTVQLRGFHGTSKNEALASGLASMTTSLVMPIIPSPASPTEAPMVAASVKA
ncbi:hypothetical protein BGZ80_001229 [Entomortierella chlamydospora]|uniref:Uncharacterized protein n=1 Tax=Entomortierella chlamydospora TaxID=101097 RepID=A0A9P6SY37_9FUNG|nr:hypothetical protein BGZ79_010599 [Entomortierella chlamydospora]KAG0010720.1 hypothetical protein BGZ80_001229 [Entomortierella chlamydospora]